MRKLIYALILFALIGATSIANAAVIVVDFNLSSNLNVGAFNPIGPLGSGTARIAFNAGPGGSATATTAIPGFVTVQTLSLNQPINFTAVNTAMLIGSANFTGSGQGGNLTGGGALNLNGSGANGGLNVASTLHCSGVMASIMLCTNVFALMSSAGPAALSASSLKINLSQGSLGTSGALLTFKLFGSAFGKINNGVLNNIPVFVYGTTYYKGQYFFLTGTEVGRTFVPEPGSFSLLGLGLLGLGGVAWRARRALR